MGRLLYNVIRFTMINQKILKGKWIIQYSPTNFSTENVLEFLVDIQKWLHQKKLYQSNKKVLIDKSVKENLAIINERGLFIQIKNHQFIFTNKGNFQNQTFKNFEIKQNIKKILLIYPVLLTDKRWLSIDLPTATLYLGSALTSQSFKVEIKKLVLPSRVMDENIQKYDVIGITLYEDLFNEIKDFLTLLRDQYHGIIATGGPMVTLNPMQTAYHLPQINLLIRGESEFIFPAILKSIQKNSIEQMLKWKGFIYHAPGKMIVSDFSTVNYPPDFSEFEVNLDFLRKNHLGNGLELNVSRGCQRGCRFCSKVQGKVLRKFPEKIFETILIKHTEKIPIFSINSSASKTINLNDDDILQDVKYAKKIFKLIQKHNYKLWGIQAAINSFFINNHKINRETLSVVSDRDLFVNNTPVIWLGTDTFSKKRSKKIGKWIPGTEPLIELINEFEERNISNYHYWICSDHNSSWYEFVEEFLFIHNLLSRFEKFSILAHSPFLIPYSTTRLYLKLIKNPLHREQIKYKANLKTKNGIFDFPLINRLETRYPNLNRLLNNEKIDGENGFFDFLKHKEYINALKNIYTFLKRERLSFESVRDHEQSRGLSKIETKLEKHLSSLI